MRRERRNASASRSEARAGGGTGRRPWQPARDCLWQKQWGRVRGGASPARKRLAAAQASKAPVHLPGKRRCGGGVSAQIGPGWPGVAPCHASTDTARCAKKASMCLRRRGTSSGGPGVKRRAAGPTRVRRRGSELRRNPFGHDRASVAEGTPEPATPTAQLPKMLGAPPLPPGVRTRAVPTGGGGRRRSIEALTNSVATASSAVTAGKWRRRRNARRLARSRRCPGGAPRPGERERRRGNAQAPRQRLQRASDGLAAPRSRRGCACRALS